MDIVVEKGYICQYQYAGTNSGYYKSNQMVDLISEKISSYYIDKVENWKGVDIKTIQPHELIYFTKQAEFPRNKLKEIIPNQVTRKIESADYIVINKDSLSKSIKNSYCQDWYWDGQDWVNYRIPNTHGQKTAKFVSTQWDRNIVNNFEAIKELQTKKIILDEDLCRVIPREVEIKGDLYEKLKKMLTCNDKSTIKIGVEILSNLNYDEFEVETVILLNQSMHNIRAYQLDKTVLFKSLLTNVVRDYPDYQTSDHLSFILRLLNRHQDNPKTLELVNDYFNQKHPTERGYYKITIVEDLLGEKIRKNELDLQGEKV